ncbi:MAG: hypothetical protein DCO95_02890 [Roseivirga sp. XM-24bin3]|nr:MAG: hypothetical protein DCO95_02890 [Roseivirga sp. XM-24bin3]
MEYRIQCKAGSIRTIHRQSWCPHLDGIQVLNPQPRQSIGETPIVAVEQLAPIGQTTSSGLTNETILSNIHPHFYVNDIQKVDANTFVDFTILGWKTHTED